jgi:hypothetical protein
MHRYTVIANNLHNLIWRQLLGAPVVEGLFLKNNVTGFGKVAHPAFFLSPYTQRKKNPLKGKKKIVNP